MAKRTKRKGRVLHHWKIYYPLLRKIAKGKRSKLQLPYLFPVEIWTLSTCLTPNYRSCSIGINRFNGKWFRLTQLTFSNRTLFQPFSMETRSLLGIVITRLPFNLPVRGLITQVTCKQQFFGPAKTTAAATNAFSTVSTQFDVACEQALRGTGAGVELISANQYFASKIWTRHSKFNAVRAGSPSTPAPVPRRACSQAKFDAGWKSWATKPTENGFLPIEHETTQPTQPTWNGWSQ